MQKDPLYSKIVNQVSIESVHSSQILPQPVAHDMQVVSEVRIEGGHRKPTYEDVLLVQLCMSPYWGYLWAQKLYKKYVTKEVRKTTRLAFSVLRNWIATITSMIGYSML